VRQIYDGVLTPEMAVNTFRNIDRLFPTRTVPRASTPMPLPPDAAPLRTVSFSDRGKRYDLEDYLELNRVAGLLVLEEGRVKFERYRFGNSERTRWMSIAKSITSTLIGAAVKQGHYRQPLRCHAVRSVAGRERVRERLGTRRPDDVVRCTLERDLY
jgi:hypothetical protein